MKVSFKWLREYFNDDLNLDDLCNKLTMSGTKVEKVDSNKVQVTNVVTGLIENIKPHPDAEKLVICDVNVGSNNVQIVTGAKNMSEGDIVPVALHGAVLAGGLKIKKGKLRGVESQGMMCSEEELGLSNSSDGLMIMDKSTPVGKNIVDVLDTGDDIIEFEITSNRPDCLGVNGIVREIEAIYDIKARQIKKDFSVDSSHKVHNFLSVELKNTNCRRYSSRVIRNVKICDSPKFIQDRLLSYGISPINNMVDLTNYVMIELGQPMHVFDYDKIEGGKITVDNAMENERVVLLDGVERNLNVSMLCIKDCRKVLALAGIMGGDNSKVTNSTNTVVIESANFNFGNIRSTSKILNLRSESSSRFEKGIDDNFVIDALDRFCSLVDEFSYGDIVDGTIDIINDSYKPVSIDISCNYINEFLKTSISKNEIMKIFTNLDMKVIENDDVLTVVVPTFRRDVSVKQDLVEEIARIYGYDKIPSSDLICITPDLGKNKKNKFIDNIMDTMVSFGFSQLMSYSFFNPKVFDKLNLEGDNKLRNAIKIKNPLGEDYSVMRTTIVPSILDSLYRNHRSYCNDNVCIFEIGKTYFRNGDSSIGENNVLAFGMYGNDVNYYTIKGVVEGIFKKFGVVFSLERETESFYHPGQSAKILLGKNTLGRFGTIHPVVLRNYDVCIDFFVAEINIDRIFEIYKQDKKYKAIPKYPSVVFDLSIVVDDSVLSQDIEKIIKSKSGGIFEGIKVFDVYKGHQIPEGKKSISYSIIFRDRNKTLNDVEVNNVIDKILDNLKANFGAELRK